MKIIFLGLGSIGTRHARLIKENFNHEVYAFDIDKKKSKNELGIKVVYSWEDVKKINPDVAFITNPTALHIPTAIKCAELCMDLFIEKPLSHNKENLDKLRELVKNKKLKTYIGYCLRFHPVIAWLKDYLKNKKPLHVRVTNISFLPSWRPGQNHKKNYSSFKDKGGGVILELSHELDFLTYLFGNIIDIKANSSRISDVTVDSEDFADFLIRLENNIFCNIHLNFLSQNTKREIHIDLKDESIIGDLINNKITIIKDNQKKEMKFNIRRDSIYLNQLKYFFENYNTKLMNDLDEAIPIFNKIIEAKEVAGL